MSEVQSKLSPYKNKNLFSRHYLTDRLERTSIWGIDDKELENAYDELERIYNEQKELLPHITSNEVEVRNEFINPILRQVLNFKKHQEAKSGNSQKVPDYALYDTSKKKAKALETEDYYENAIGILEAKAWKKDLEKKTATGDPSTDDSNPTKQIVSYLIENKPQWGILTNGKKWRLVNRDASNRLDTYYEVDIENLLTSDRPREERLEEFKYFYIFFRKQAFQGDEGDKLLDELLEESLRYAEDIGEDLEENIYRALEWLAKGFIENNSNEGIEDIPIEDIHDNCLIYLYRLLFALYADSRGILGDPSGKYDSYNFSALVDEVCEELDEGDGYGKTGLISSRLNAIFRMIDEGSQAQGIPRDEVDIPAYNGGLFNQDKHEFLKKYNLHDEYLAKVIDLVARTEREEGGRAQVDYYDLSVRHLGGIYEGLLEYQLEKADEDMVEVKEDGDKVVKTVEEAEDDGDTFSDDDLIEEGQPYLVTDDGERKATGSYYTPDYIVKYIVANTVGPKLEEELEDLETDEEKAEAILNMQILDPAMGSAHFLVEVIDYLAQELVDYKEIDVEHAKREIARQCVYGVDVNRLATELGKLSIWLKTISEDKPLSFLNHHIKTGNSLIGADIHDINRHPEEDEDSERQVTIGEEFGEENAGVVRANVQEMLKRFKEIQEKQADSPEDVKEQEELYQEFLDFPFRKRFDVLADVYTSHYFDNDYKVDDYNRLLQAFKLSEQKEEGDEEWNKIIKEDWVQKATDSLDNSHEEDNTSKEKGFFHWKLEFPEVFFDIEEGIEKQDSGFDALVGNPPWGEQVIMQIKDYMEVEFDVSKQNLNAFDVFTRQATKLSDGNLGFLLPRNLARSNDYSDLREYVLQESTLLDIKDWKKFPGITLEALSLITNPSETIEREFVRINGEEFLTNQDLKDADGSIFNIYSNKKQYEIKERIADEPRGWDQHIKIKRGEEISRSAKIMKCPSCEMWRKHTKKDDIECPHCDEENSRQNWEIDTLLADKESGRRIVDGTDIKENFIGNGRYIDLDKPGIDSKKSMGIYRSNKILMKKIAKEPVAAYDDENTVFTQNVYGIRPSDSTEIEIEFLLGILNSKAMKFFYEHNFNLGAEWTTAISITNIRNEFPVPQMSESKREKIKTEVEKTTKSYKKIRSGKKNFIEWLRNYLETDIEEFSGKTYITELIKKETSEDKLFSVLTKSTNRRKIESNSGINPKEDMNAQNVIRDNWRETKSTINEGQEEIKETEAIIDGIVFQYYDLTEEEVETVLDSLDTPEGDKASILEKFEEVSSRSPISSPQV